MSMGWLKALTEANLAELLRVVNLYQYAGNNPINEKDSLGLHKGLPGPWPCMGGTAGGGGGGGVVDWGKSVPGSL
jgi:hypothetical protein